MSSQKEEPNSACLMRPCLGFLEKHVERLIDGICETLSHLKGRKTTLVSLLHYEGEV